MKKVLNEIKQSRGGLIFLPNKNVFDDLLMFQKGIWTMGMSKMVFVIIDYGKSETTDGHLLEYRGANLQYIHSQRSVFVDR